MKTTKERDLQEIKKKLRKMYLKEKTKRRKTLFTKFIDLKKCIERKYHETKLFEKKVQELKNKNLLHMYSIDPLFQMIYVKKKN
jgi:predicted nucleic acid-binding OB-fold protein